MTLRSSSRSNSRSPKDNPSWPYQLLFGKRERNQRFDIGR